MNSNNEEKLIYAIYEETIQAEAENYYERRLTEREIELVKWALIEGNDGHCGLDNLIFEVMVDEIGSCKEDNE